MGMSLANQCVTNKQHLGQCLGNIVIIIYCMPGASRTATIASKTLLFGHARLEKRYSTAEPLVRNRKIVEEWNHGALAAVAALSEEQTTKKDARKHFEIFVVVVLK
jgi:hypothetical protein